MPTKKQKRWVYGTRTRKWYLVGEEDRDFESGIPQELFKGLGKMDAIGCYFGRALIFLDREFDF